MLVIFIYFILFQNIIINVAKLPDFFNYWDEATTLLLFFYLIIYIIRKKKNRVEDVYFNCFLLIMACISIGILGNIIFKYNDNVQAIARDIVNFLKFPLTFLSLKIIELDEKISKKINGSFIKNLKIYCIDIYKIIIIV